MKAIYVIISIAALALLAPAASALIINIPGDYPTIQEGIDAAQNGDTVLVAPGEYEEYLTIDSKNIRLLSSRGPGTTIIRGSILFVGNVDTTCTIRGFRVHSDHGNESAITMRYCSPLLDGNIITDGGMVYVTGGGVSAFYSSGIIRNNIIRSNAATLGGGIYADTNVTIEKNIVIENSAFSGGHGAAGGGIAASKGIIRYNIIANNQAWSGYWIIIGGGIYANGGSNHEIRIYNNTIVGNTASGEDNNGGGFCYGPGNSEESDYVMNNIIAFNENGGGVFSSFSDSGGLIWDYNLVFGNEPYDYSGFNPGPHDVQADPLFVDRFSGDYHLLPNSPCIDAGDPDFPLDPDGSRADIGAYYFDQTVGIDDPGEPSGPYQFQLHQNYPNPFNAQTIISYTLSESSAVSLMIFSITGHFVKSIVNKEVQQPGEYRYIWDGGNKSGQHVATGIYFYELYVDDYRESKAMIMIK